MAFQNAMPEVLESLGTPKSLEGLMARADDVAEEEADPVNTRRRSAKQRTQHLCRNRAGRRCWSRPP